jgi:dihydroorotate dehydrogenase (fumarate)
MEEHEYESIDEMQGSMSYCTVSDPANFERAQYVRGLQSYRIAPSVR